MKKMLCTLSVVLVGVFSTANIYADDCCAAPANDCCAPAAAAPCDASTGDCWCRYVHWQPQYYQTQRCVNTQVPCQKQCCRMVPKYYTVQCCKYVPQNYDVKVCRYEPEYYCEPDCKTVTSTVCDQHCRYVPQYYWKHTCGETAACSTNNSNQ